MTKVLVVGGGYGGITVAKALDDVAEVVLIEPREAFVHNVAALRAVVDPSWAERIFIPYDGLLANGRIRRAWAERVTADARVELGGGDVETGDYVVLATGSSYPYPAKIGIGERDRLAETHRELEKASHVLLVGAGPVGLEFAGEIRAAWPDKRITVVDRADDLMPGDYPAEFRDLLRDQLYRMEIAVVTAPVDADLRFDCFGARPETGYADLPARRPDGRLAVEADLRVCGTENIFAIGDITALPELKMARLAQMHARVAADNIRALIEGRTGLTAYQPQPDAIVLPLGPYGGVSYAPEAGVLGPEQTAAIKAGFYLDQYRELLGQA
ncbi:FAD-dependent oxidoreductase [Paractinoplanes toevensis]|uniref:FAD/NAD(P)-binding domain-containing protein n=1 Tax=Paractinoplanes toevensis TaxID=571911 RepID=A0A919W973_9ACTN|nr:FAD-dependent oxidoreductase [Actinoplanes toevensis]GIM95897.1 hypothetical protein Ato02nite_076900 [Actinoplanes toevensis]